MDIENYTITEQNISNVPEVDAYVTQENCCATVYYLHHHYHFHDNSSQDFNATLSALFSAFLNTSSMSPSIQDKVLKNIQLTMASTFLLLVMLCVIIAFYVRKHFVNFLCVQRLRELLEEWRLQEARVR